MNRFLGDSPLRVLVKLLVLSLLVGFVMSAFGLSPLYLWDSLVRAVVRLWDLGFAAFDRFFEYIVIGAMVVVPVFLLLRLASYRRDRG